MALEQATRASSVAGGVLASRARRWLARHRLRDGLLAGARPAGGAVLVNEAYLASARRLLENAADAANLLVFLGTANPGDPLHPGPLQLVEAMEAAAARGVTVRAILDQDDGGAPYGSVFINRPLVERFRANGVGVKFDREDVLLHSKVLIVDRTAAIVGSHNWTGASLNDTHELSLLVEAPEVASQFDDRFQSLWDQLPTIG
jgi:phosphatidylserine/phosphatidylglycerophosphate/cardiolipin synthase-like enzyme